MKKNQHVVPYKRMDGRQVWAIKTPNSKRVSGVFEKQIDAELFARVRAKSNKSELVIHDKKGCIRERSSYK